MPVSFSEAAAKVASVHWWYHRYEIYPGLITPGVNDTLQVLESLALPEDCRGLRALDLGTRDGFFAFELKRRGADVLGIDSVPMSRTGFAVGRELLGLDVEYVQEDIFRLRPEIIGTFDIVLFLGLLYHLRDPMAAIQIVRRLCRRDMWLETQIIDDALLQPDGTFTSLAALSPVLTQTPLMQFYPVAALNGDPSNYWAPNVACAEAMLRENQFDVVSRVMLGQRAIFRSVAVDDDTPKLRYSKRHMPWLSRTAERSSIEWWRTPKLPD